MLFKERHLKNHGEDEDGKRKHKTIYTNLTGDLSQPKLKKPKNNEEDKVLFSRIFSCLTISCFLSISIYFSRIVP